MFEQIQVDRILYGKGENLLLQGDASQPQSCLAELAGTAQAVYLDPPFMTGDVYSRKRRFGMKGWRSGSPTIEVKAYEDRFQDRNAYLAMLRGLIENAWLLLSPTGMLCLHLDWHASHLGRMLCDEIFGPDNFVNEIIWAYESGGRAKNHFSRKHDSILMYAKSSAYTFHLDRVSLPRGETRHNHMKRSIDEQGRPYRSIKVNGKEYRYYDDEPVYPGDVWTDIGFLQQRDPERTGFLTQKPLKLLERLLKPLVDPGDLVVDLCCGSGTALAMAQTLGCRFLGMDISPDALVVAQSRLITDNLSCCPACVLDDVPLEGNCIPEAGCIMLAGLPVHNELFPAFTDTLEPIERWAAGRIEGNVLHVEQTSQRAIRHPAIETMCMLSPGEAPIGIAVYDAAGTCRVYRWEE